MEGVVPAQTGLVQFEIEGGHLRFGHAAAGLSWRGGSHRVHHSAVSGRAGKHVQVSQGHKCSRITMPRVFGFFEYCAYCAYCALWIN